MLKNLQAQHYNDKRGVILGFNTVSQRFVVQLECPNRRIKVKGRNIRLLCSQECYTKIRQMTAVDKPIIKPILQIIESSKSLDADSYATILNMATTRILNETFDPQILRTVVALIQEALGLSASETLKVDLTISLCLYLNALGRFDEALEIAIQMKERHFGRIPEINHCLAMSEKSNEKIIELYKEILPLLRSGNYGFWFRKGPFAATVIQAIYKEGGSRKLAKEIFEDAADDAVEMEVSIMKGCLFLMKKDYAKALKCLTEYQGIVGERYGNGSKYIIQALNWRFTCFTGLGQKREALKCLKKLKRMDLVHEEEYVELERQCKMMKRSQKSSIRVNRRMKCSNPFCAKIETKIGEYKKCSQCEVAKYCSKKCQRKHWKKGHKKECLANASS